MLSLDWRDRYGTILQAGFLTGVLGGYVELLSSIAKRHTIEVAQLREWNHLKNDQIKLGQVLRVSTR